MRQFRSLRSQPGLVSGEGEGRRIKEEVGDATFGREPADDAEPAPSVRQIYSHSMVAGGFELMSRATRFTPATSLMIRLEARSSRS